MASNWVLNDDPDLQAKFRESAKELAKGILNLASAYRQSYQQNKKVLDCLSNFCSQARTMLGNLSTGDSLKQIQDSVTGRSQFNDKYQDLLKPLEKIAKKLLSDQSGDIQELYSRVAEIWKSLEEFFTYYSKNKDKFHRGRQNKPASNPRGQTQRNKHRSKSASNHDRGEQSQAPKNSHEGQMELSVGRGHSGHRTGSRAVAATRGHGRAATTERLYEHKEDDCEDNQDLKFEWWSLSIKASADCKKNSTVRTLDKVTDRRGRVGYVATKTKTTENLEGEGSYGLFGFGGSVNRSSQTTSSSTYVSESVRQKGLPSKDLFPELQ